MTRSIVLRSHSQKKTPPVSAVARRRQRTGKSSSDSSTSSSSSPNDDAPYRNLRKRASTEAKQVADRKTPPVDKKPRASVDKERPGRKRAMAPVAAEAPSLPVKEPKTKKRKTPSSLSVATTQPESVYKAPLTRSQRQKLNQVTPSPTQNPASPSFSFSTPLTKRKGTRVFDISSKVPKGVVDIYPSSRPVQHHCGTTNCTCRDDVCSSKSLSAEFIRVYGQEYTQFMKDNEDPILAPLSPDDSVSSSRYSDEVLDAVSRIMASQSPSSASSTGGFSVIDDETPCRRRVWSTINTSKLVPVKAYESTRYFAYQPELTPKMRAILIDWIIELSEHFNFGPSTLHLACTLVDQVMACGLLTLEDDDDDHDDTSRHWDEESRTNIFLIPREKFQLLGATCTWLACKIEEQSPPQVSQIAYVSDNIYSVEQIKRMERRVCNALNFGLVRQTPYPYIFEFVRASCECTDPGCELPPVFYNMVLYLLEVGRLPYLPITKKPSLLAAAAVYLARVTLGVPGGPWTKTLEYYTGYGKEDLKDVVLAIHKYQLAAEDSNLKSVFSKYKAKKYRRVALKTAPRQEDLGF